MLQAELYEMSKLQQRLCASLKNVPDGSLHVMKKKEKKEYYLYDSSKKRKYISKKEKELIIKLAQKEYDAKLIALVNKRIKAGYKLAEAYDIPLDAAYDAINKTKQELIIPYKLSDQEYIKKWYEDNPGRANTYPISTNLYSNRGEHLRSKSEKIIADFLDKYDIPYVYEPKILFANGQAVYPDFLILNVQLRKSFIYEHFGLMSDSRYAEKTNEKINQYMLNNYMLGINFLFTMESQTEPLNTKIIEKIIENYLI